MVAVLVLVGENGKEEEAEPLTSGEVVKHSRIESSWQPVVVVVTMDHRVVREVA
jgi:hypothetical protein